MSIETGSILEIIWLHSAEILFHSRDAAERDIRMSIKDVESQIHVPAVETQSQPIVIPRQPTVKVNSDHSSTNSEESFLPPHMFATRMNNDNDLVRELSMTFKAFFHLYLYLTPFTLWAKKLTCHLSLKCIFQQLPVMNSSSWLFLILGKFVL